MRLLAIQFAVLENQSLVLEGSRIAMQSSVAEDIFVWRKEVSPPARYAS